MFFSQAHESLRQQVREFAEGDIAPVARRLDEESRFPWDNVRRMADMGLFGVDVPREYGGMGLDYTSYLIVVEELARVDASHSITVSAHSTLGLSPILAFGSEEQKTRFAPLLASGRVLGGFGLTEPGAGSDAGATRTRAERDGDGYRINGSKIFITHAGVGEIFVVTAVTDRSRGPHGISSFIVTKPTAEPEEAERVGVGHAPELEPYTAGVRAGRKEDKMGWRASDTRELFLEDAWVPESSRLGPEGEGFINFMKTLDAGRIGVGALSLGIAQGAFDHALAHLRSLGVGRRAGEQQAAQFVLADMATEIEAARHMVFHAAWLKEKERRFSRAAAMAKLFSSELAMRVTTRAVQLLGPEGLSADHPVERMLRDAKICEIGEGTSEVQRLVIARSFLGTGGS